MSPYLGIASRVALSRIEMGRNQFWRRVGKPFGERQVLVVAGLEHFEKFQVGVAHILDIMRKSFLDVADVTHFEVHGPGACASGKDGHARFATDVELPFVGVWMPVQFAHAARFHGDNRRGDCRRDLEAA